MSNAPHRTVFRTRREFADVGVNVWHAESGYFAPYIVGDFQKQVEIGTRRKLLSNLAWRLVWQYCAANKTFGAKNNAIAERAIKVRKRTYRRIGWSDQM